jgi:RNA polymerase sigma factor (sigma-70 family)
MAEEVAQDVFLAAHRALAEQRYRGDSALSTWLFGIARNLCSKARRDLYRQALPLAWRRLEHEMVWPEHQAGDQVVAPAWRLCHRLERAREHFQQCVREAAHCTPSGSPDVQDLAGEACLLMRDSMQRLARQDRQAYILLHMHVCKGLTVRELAGLQGMSRSAVARSLLRARATLRTTYQAAFVAQDYRGPARRSAPIAPVRRAACLSRC